MENDKKKSYYKSRKREFEYDSAHKSWYFTIASDPTKKKFCYAGYALVLQDVKPYAVIYDLITYKLHSKISSMMVYDDYLELKNQIKTMPNIIDCVNFFKKKYSDALLAFNNDFGSKYKNDIDSHNRIIYKLVAEKEIYGF